MAEQWLSIVEYARTFAMSDMTVRRRIKNGKLHAVLKDGKYFIPLDEKIMSRRPAGGSANLSHDIDDQDDYAPACLSGVKANDFLLKRNHRDEARRRAVLRRRE